MDKSWVDMVKEKVDSFYSRRQEIDKTLNTLLHQLKSQLNIRTDCDLIDENNLVWKVKIGKQTFTIEEKEIAENQIVRGADQFRDDVDTGQRVSVEKVLQKLILEKLKSF